MDPREFSTCQITHREGLKRSFVGIGGLEVRGRQCLALTLMCYLMVAHYRRNETSGTKKEGKPKLPLRIDTPPKSNSIHTSCLASFRPVEINTPSRSQTKPCWCRWTRSPEATVSCFDMVCHLMIARPTKCRNQRTP